MTSQTLKIGICGAGFAADVHLAAFSEIPRAEIRSVCSRSTKSSKKLSEKWNIPKIYTDLEKAIADPELDCIDICLPNNLHEKAVTFAAENNKMVICEKPLGRNAIEAQKMLSAVRKAGTPHAYAENQVFMPAIQRAKELVEQGAIGEIFWIRTREAHFGPHSAWFWEPESAGGGVALDMGCHSVEVARWFIRTKPVEVFSWLDTLVHKTQVEDNSLILVRYKNRELAQAENSWAAHGGLDLRIEIHGSKGAIFVDPTRETSLKCFSLRGSDYVVEKGEILKGWLYPIIEEHRTYGYVAELKHFVTSFLKDELPQETFEDGLLVNKIIDASYRSNKTKAWEQIK